MKYYTALAVLGLALLCPSLRADDAPASAPSTWGYKVVQTLPIGGEGRWDYVTIDAKTHHLFVPRSTYTQVIDTETGKVIADWAGTAGVHGVAPAPELGLAFTSNGKTNNVSVIDLKTNEKVADVAAGKGPDAIVYDAASSNVLACNHKGGTVTFISTAAAADKKFPAQELEIGGSLEYAVVDGAGHAFVDVEDKNQVVEIDTKAVKVLNRWPTTGGEAPTGIAIDVLKGRLYVSCGDSKTMLIMNTQDGSILATLPIGDHSDGAGFDPGTSTGFASCGDGTLAVVQESADHTFTVQSVPTKIGARTIAVDTETHRIYMPTAEMVPGKPGERPTAKPDTFQIVVVGK